MSALTWLMLLYGVLQTLVLIDALPDGFNVYKGESGFMVYVYYQ